jgi:hypothetical protein
MRDFIADKMFEHLRELVQLATQPLSSGQLRDLAGPLTTLSSALLWSAFQSGGPLAIILSSLSMMDKGIALLTVLLRLVMTVVSVDLSSLLLQVVIQRLNICLEQRYLTNRKIFSVVHEILSCLDLLKDYKHCHTYACNTLPFHLYR